MKRVLLSLSYDGTAYHGWQVQENAITVQQTVQDALEKMFGFRPDLTGCSRTDAGVHAKMFCCHLDCAENLPKETFLRGLNAVLPNDIAVWDVKEVPPDFHARYSARGKNYIYRFYVSPVTDPFLSRYALRLDRHLNEAAVQTFCDSLVGTHDFLPFSSSGRSVADTVRTVKECNLIAVDGQPALSVTADGFLYNMVRIIVGTALAVSSGKTAPNCADAIFAAKDRTLAGETAPPQGLFLNKVFY